MANYYGMTYLNVKYMFIMRVTLFIIFNFDEIELRFIYWGRITPFSAQVVYCMMIDIVIGIYYKLCGLLSCVPTTIGNSGLKNKTSFVNTNIVWSLLSIWIN